MPCCGKARPLTQPNTAPQHKQKPPAPAPEPPPARPTDTGKGTGAGGGAGRLPSRTASAAFADTVACGFLVTYPDGSVDECGSRLEAQAALTRAGGVGRITPV